MSGLSMKAVMETADLGLTSEPGTAAWRWVRYREFSEELTVTILTLFAAASLKLACVQQNCP